MKYTPKNLINHFQEDNAENKKRIQEDKKMMKNASPGTVKHEKREISGMRKDISMHEKMIKKLKKKGK